MSLVTDDEDACGGFDDVISDGFELIDFQDSSDLGCRASDLVAGLLVES